MRNLRYDAGERGIMLLELLLALGIMALAAALTAPAANFVRGGLVDFELDREARSFMAEARYVEEMAATYRRVNGQFPSAANETQPTLRLMENSYRVMQSNKTLRNHVLPDGMVLKCAESRTELIFSNGEALTATIQLMKDGRSRYVIIDRVGRVRLSDRPLTPES